MFAAIHLASSKVSTLAIVAAASSRVDIGEGLSVAVEDFKPARYLLNGPRCREAAGHSWERAREVRFNLAPASLA